MERKFTDFQIRSQNVEKERHKSEMIARESHRSREELEKAEGSPLDLDKSM